MRKYKYLSLLLFTAAILLIVCFHSEMNLRERLTPPSEMWGRHISLGITDFKKIPSLYTEGTDTVVVFADEKGFKRVKVDRSGHIIDRENISIKDYIPRRLVKYQLEENKLFWTENYDLFYADLESSKPVKQKLLSDILDFQLLNAGNEISIVVSSKKSICLYDFSCNGSMNLKAEAELKGASYINAARDGKGNIYIAGVSTVSPTEYKLKLFSYDISDGGLLERVEPVTIENSYSSREGSNSINNLELGFDEKDIYMFYEIGKASSQGMVAKTYMGYFPKDSKGIVKLAFERLKLDNSSENDDTYISSLKCADSDSGKLSMIVTTPLKTSVSEESAELVYLVMDQGDIVCKSTATNTGKWNSLASLNKLDNQYVAVFLQTIGASRYTVNLTSTTEEYRENLNKTTINDVKYSVMGTVGAYVFSFFAIFINLLTASLILLWPVAVDFFGWKLFLDNPLAAFRVGAVAESITMYFSIARIYKDAESVALMPGILKYGFSPVGMLLVTAVISYFIVRLYRKSREDLHSFAELALFILIHNILVYFLYTAYIVRF